METDIITSIEIDQEGRLHLITKSATFPMIYRTATEVHWNPEKHSLYSPRPRDWTYGQWYEHICDVAELVFMLWLLIKGWKIQEST